MDRHFSDLSIETSFVYDFNSRGASQGIDYINPSEVIRNTKLSEAVFLFTEGNRVYYQDESIYHGTAIVVDSNMTVIQTINRTVKCDEQPEFVKSTDIDVPAGGFVILAIDDDYVKTGIRKFFAENFRVGDLVKLKFKNVTISLHEVLQIYEKDIDKPFLVLDGRTMDTTNLERRMIKGVVIHANHNSDISIVARKYGAENNLIEEYNYQVTDNHSQKAFIGEIPLTYGVNYIDIMISVNDAVDEQTKKNLIVYRKREIPTNQKQVIMWVEQYVNAEALNTVEKMEQVISKAKASGITGFAVDVKGCEGYTAYHKSTITKAPYMTKTRNPRKHITMELDFLEEFIRVSHKHGIKVYASFNFFTEGVISTKDYAIDVPMLHPDWAEVLQAPEDGGELKNILDTKKESVILYVNPANDEVQDFQLKRAEEVLINYDIDGIVMDRTRYDHQYADFSNISRDKFIKYLEQQNKTLEHWPEDIYAIRKDGSMLRGKYYSEWITFRSTIIRDFSKRLRALVNRYREEKNRDIKLAAYVGSWYESYYQNGVNWASEDFVYNHRLNFPYPNLYNAEYAKASYLKNIDFMMIGCYYDTKELIGKYITLGNIITKEEVPLIGGISIPSLKTPQALREGVQEVFEKSNGTMLFDLCYTDWETLKSAITDE